MREILGLTGASSVNNQTNRKENFSENISREFNIAGGILHKVSFWDTAIKKDPEGILLKSLQKLPDESELPPFIKTFLSDIKGINDLDKIKAIHNFTLNNIEYIDQSCSDELNPKDLFKGQEIQGDCDDFATYNSALMHYAGLKDVGLLGGIIKYTYADNTAEDGGHAVALAKIDGRIYMLDQNFAEPVAMKDGKTTSFNAMSGEGEVSMKGETAVAEFERIKLLVEYGGNKGAYLWNHPDDDKYYTSDCPEDAAKTPDPAAPAQDQPKVQSGTSPKP